MNQSYVLKKAILSEKAYALMKRGTYTFLVDARAHKEEIAKAVGLQFGVSVAKVRISKFAPKIKRIMSQAEGKRRWLHYLPDSQLLFWLQKQTRKRKKLKKKKAPIRRNNAA